MDVHGLEPSPARAAAATAQTTATGVDSTSAQGQAVTRICSARYTHFCTHRRIFESFGFAAPTTGCEAPGQKNLQRQVYPFLCVPASKDVQANLAAPRTKGPDLQHRPHRTSTPESCLECVHLEVVFKPLSKPTLWSSWPAAQGRNATHNAASSISSI